MSIVWYGWPMIVRVGRVLSVSTLTIIVFMLDRPKKLVSVRVNVYDAGIKLLLVIVTGWEI